AEDRSPRRVNDFARLVEAELNTKLSPGQFSNDRFQRLKADATFSFQPPSQDEIALAKVLADRDARTLATSIKRAGGILESDIGKQLPGRNDEQISRARSSLEQVGIVSEEIVVICRSTSRQVFRAPSTAAIATMTAQGIR